MLGTSVTVITVDNSSINTVNYFLNRLKIINESYKNLYYRKQRESAFGYIDDMSKINEAIEKNTITIEEISNIINFYYKQ